MKGLVIFSSQCIQYQKLSGCICLFTCLLSAFPFGIKFHGITDLVHLGQPALLLNLLDVVLANAE
jgi:hypothetical protein